MCIYKYARLLRIPWSLCCPQTQRSGLCRDGFVGTGSVEHFVLGRQCESMVMNTLVLVSCVV